MIPWVADYNRRMGMLLYAATMNYVEVVPSGEVKVHSHG